MPKIVIIPDSFKGTLSSAQVCDTAAEGIRSVILRAQIRTIPVADGGEGTVDAFLAAVGGHRVTLPCRGPFGETVEGFYGVLPDGTAVVEMAAAAGLPLAAAHPDPCRTTTYGVGELMAHALSHGAKKLILALGGSATNDGGCGAAAALGVRFLDEAGAEFVPTGGTLGRIARISLDRRSSALEAAALQVMCDIDNPLCGPTGASAVFGPQKGADDAAVALLDENLRHLARVMARDLGQDVLELPGGGAAGGFGAGAVALLGGRLQMGIDTLLDAVDFDTLAADADLIVTGEGNLDRQSLRGKVVIGVARRARRLGVPVAALVGGSDTDIARAYEAGVSGVFPIHPRCGTLAALLPESREHLLFTAKNLAHFFLALRGPFPD